MSMIPKLQRCIAWHVLVMSRRDGLAQRQPGLWALLEQDYGNAGFGRKISGANHAGPHGVHRLSLVNLREDGSFAYRSLLILNTDDCSFEVDETRAEGWVCNYKPGEGLKLQAAGPAQRKRCNKGGDALQASSWAALPYPSTCDYRGADPRERPVPPLRLVIDELEAAFPALCVADAWSTGAEANWETVVPTALWARHELIE